MIVSMVFDALQTNLRQLGWANYLFLDRQINCGWRCITEEKYLSWTLGEQDRQDLYGAQSAWNFSFDPDPDALRQKIDAVSDAVFDACKKQYGVLSVWKLLSERWEPLEKELNEYLDRYEREEKIEGIVVYPKAYASVRYIAEQRRIPLFVLEVAPMRWPIYTGGAYLSHEDQQSTDRGECERLYLRFKRERNENRFPLLSREQLLAVFLESSYLPYLRYRSIAPRDEALLIGNGMMGKGDVPKEWDQTMKLAQILRSRFGESVAFRPDGRDPYRANFGMSEKQYAQESPNIVSLLRAKRVACAGGNMMFEAMLWGKPVYCDTESHGLYFICNHTDQWTDRCAPTDFLNFFALVYIAPMDLATQDEYVRWRLKEPTLEELYKKHLAHYLKRWGLDNETFFKLSEEASIQRIAEAKGVEYKRLAPLPPMDMQKAWMTFFGETRYSAGPVIERCERQKAELSASREKIRELQEEIQRRDKHAAELSESLDAANTQLEKIKAELQGEMQRTEMLEKVCTESAQDYEALSEKHQRVCREKEKMQQQLEAILESRSWKLTAPLRTAHKRYTRIK